MDVFLIIFSASIEGNFMEPVQRFHIRHLYANSSEMRRRNMSLRIEILLETSTLYDVIREKL